jgi:hypothetical protein
VSSVIRELQRDALDRQVRVSDLLRKALVVARKLGLREFQAWIEKELSGYGREDDVPKYREVSGQVRAWNPYSGWIPVTFEDARHAEVLSHRPCGQSIAELEHLVEGEKGSFFMPFPHELQRQLSRGMGFQTEVTLIIPHTEVARIIDVVRTIILNWALKLEEDGIIGKGLSFTHQEKEAAEQTPQSITNFYGPVQIQQGSPRATQVLTAFTVDPAAIRSFLEMVRQRLGSLDLRDDQRREVEAEIRTVESQLESPQPKTSIIREALESVRRILESAGGSAVAQLLIELGRILPVLWRAS